MSKNPCAKLVTPENAYRVYQSGGVTYFVLKMYQHPDSTDPDAQWLVAVATQSPTLPNDFFERAAMYAKNLKDMVLVDNPLCNYVCIRTDDEMTFTLSMLERYRYSLLRAKHPQLVNYWRLAVPKKKLATFKRIAAEHGLHVACIDSQNEVDDCLNDFHAERIRLMQEGQQQYQEEQEQLPKQHQEEDQKGE